jgi:hypothetical protein
LLMKSSSKIAQGHFSSPVQGELLNELAFAIFINLYDILDLLCRWMTVNDPSFFF